MDEADVEATKSLSLCVFFPVFGLVFVSLCGRSQIALSTLAKARCSASVVLRPQKSLEGERSESDEAVQTGRDVRELGVNVKRACQRSARKHAARGTVSTRNRSKYD